MKRLFIAALFLLCLPFAHAQMFWSQNYSLAKAKTQIYTESFAYANNTDLVADAPTQWQYSASGIGIDIYSNLAHVWMLGPPEAGNTTFPGLIEWIGAGTINTNQYATATFSVISTVEVGPAVRVSGNSAYAVDCYSGGCKLIKTVSGTETSLNSFGTPIANGSTVELDAVGTAPTVLTILVNGVNYATYTDSSSPLTVGTTGFASIYSSSNSGNTSISNVTGGNLQ